MKEAEQDAGTLVCGVEAGEDCGGVELLELVGVVEEVVVEVGPEHASDNIAWMNRQNY